MLIRNLKLLARITEATSFHRLHIVIDIHVSQEVLHYNFPMMIHCSLADYFLVDECEARASKLVNELIICL